MKMKKGLFEGLEIVTRPAVVVVEGRRVEVAVCLRPIPEPRYVLRARTVLADAELALRAWESTDDPGIGRVHYASVLMLLRAVGHVLAKVDAIAHLSLRHYVPRRFAEWKADPKRYRLFSEFIDPERNAILKEYEFGVIVSQVVGVSRDCETGEIRVDETDSTVYAYKSGPFVGEDVRDVAREAMAFWEAELALCEAVLTRP